MLMAFLLAQATVEVPDTRPQRAVPATAFRCRFQRSDPGSAVTEQFDLSGLIPLAPEGHARGTNFPMLLESASGDALAGRGVVQSMSASGWYRDYQISRRVGTALHVITLKLRREGQSIAYSTIYDDAWNAGRSGGEFEPYRYGAAGLCVADFEPGTGAAGQ